MSTRQKVGYGFFGVGLILAILFFILFGVMSDANAKAAFLSAATVCVVAAANGLAVGISDRVSTGKWTGLIVGAVGLVGWGIAFLADSCAADAACTASKNSFGWAAVFAAIAGLASLLPELFGGGSASSS